MPDAGEGLTEADVVTWLVAVGDRVEVNQPLVEVETAKSLVELPCPYDGVVTELLVHEGRHGRGRRADRRVRCGSRSGEAPAPGWATLRKVPKRRLTGRSGRSLRCAVSESSEASGPAHLRVRREYAWAAARVRSCNRLRPAQSRSRVLSEETVRARARGLRRDGSSAAEAPAPGRGVTPLASPVGAEIDAPGVRQAARAAGSPRSSAST